MAILRIRVRSGVLFLGRPGELPKLIGYAADDAGLRRTLSGIAGDRTALAALRQGWPGLVPNTGHVTQSHTELVRELQRMVRMRRVDAAFVPWRAPELKLGKLAPVEAAHLVGPTGTMVFGSPAALNVPPSAICSPEQVTDFLTLSAQSRTADFTPLRTAWPLIMPGAPKVPPYSGEMIREMTAAVRAKKLGAALYPGNFGSNQAAARKDAPKPISQWSTGEKLREALSRSLHYLGASLRKQLDEFFTVENMTLMIKIMAGFAVLQAIPIVGQIVDAALIGTMLYHGGRQALDGIIELVEGAIDANGAKDDKTLEAAAKTIAKGLEHLGKGGLSLLFAWFAARSAMGKAAQSEARASRAAPRKQQPAPSERPQPRPAQAATAATKTVQKGANKAEWTLDANGRPTKVSATLSELEKGATRGRDELAAQGATGARGLVDDDAGHLIGHRFMGDQGAGNLFPQNSNFNRGAYKTMENEWAAWIEKGGTVKTDIQLAGGTADRPDKLRVFYEVFDKAGNKVFERNAQFLNEAGQVFNRVPTNKISSMMGN